MGDTTIEIILEGKPPESRPLRPIGTEFERAFPPDLATTNWEKSHKYAVYTYRVIAHRLIERFPGDTGQERREEIEAIAVRYEDAVPEGCE